MGNILGCWFSHKKNEVHPKNNINEISPTYTRDTSIFLEVISYVSENEKFENNME